VLDLLGALRRANVRHWVAP